MPHFVWQRRDVIRILETIFVGLSNKASVTKVFGTHQALCIFGTHKEWVRGGRGARWDVIAENEIGKDEVGIIIIIVITCIGFVVGRRHMVDAPNEG